MPKGKERTDKKSVKVDAGSLAGLVQCLAVWVDLRLW
jgi:hypothetical protein